MHKSRGHDPLVLMKKTLFLQRIQEAVVEGYRFYTLGSVSLERAAPVVRKFAELYGVGLDKNARYRRKATGQGNARLHLYLGDDMRLDFALLVTPGEHCAHTLERLQEVDKVPLCYREFELVRLALKGRSQPGWTWRLDAKTVRAWRDRLHLHTAHNDKAAIYQDWYSLYRTPGFAGIRKQVGDLVSFWRHEWMRHRGSSPCPMCFPHDEFRYRQISGIARREDGMYWTQSGFPRSSQLPTLFYVRKQKDSGERLGSLLRSLKNLSQGRATPE